VQCVSTVNKRIDLIAIRNKSLALQVVYGRGARVRLNVVTETLCETVMDAQIDTTYDFSEIHPQERIVFRHALFEWCLRNARRCFDNQLLEESLQWDKLAGTIAHYDCTPLSSSVLESYLIEAGKHLPVPDYVRPDSHPKGASAQSPRRWLHVLNVAHSFGGHTAMAARWMILDCEESTHSVVLLEQSSPVPPALAEAVRLTNGEIHALDAKAEILDRAAWLRTYAWQNADVVVLHISPFDVISTVAFAVPGGPPVVLVNHAAHIFWLGCSIVDFVLNCRGSALEHQWTIKYRGINAERSVTLPIPLTMPAQQDSTVERAQLKKTAKEALHVPLDAKVVLTVGSTDKYKPIPRIDFLEAAEKILQESPNSYLLAVGVDEDARWAKVREAAGGRLRAVGRQSDLKHFHDAADVYIEGFPFGSTTALMESGLKGIPCVLAPATSPPPFTTDGLALDMLDRPADLKEYVMATLALLGNEQEALKAGQAIASSLASHHCGKGWFVHIDALKKKLTAPHKIYPIPSTPSVPDYISNYWSVFTEHAYSDALALVFPKAGELGLKPKFDRKLREALHVAKPYRRRCFLINGLAAATGLLSSIMPWLVTSRYYKKLFYMFRPEGKILNLISRFGFIG
jgi:glycosyltransferase involved in cell wall biosynthesis